MCNKSLVMERVKECFAIAEARFNTTFRMPNVRFDKRGTTAGTAQGSKWELNFNMVLLNENLEHGRRMKRSPHGRNWKNIMLVLGVPADRCHEMDVSNARVSRRKSETFDYHCSGCNQTLPMGKIRHGKQQSGRANYKHCRGGTLTFVG
jgi:SprT protein